MSRKEDNQDELDPKSGESLSSTTHQVSEDDVTPEYLDTDESIA